MQYRFRYFEDQKIGLDSKDRRQFFGFEGPGDDPEEKMIESILLLVAGLKAAGFGDLEEHRLMRSGMAEAIPMISAMKCMTVTRADAGDLGVRA